MKKVNWKHSGSRKSAKATIGCVVMYCLIHYPIKYGNCVRNRNARLRWFACVSIEGHLGMFRNGPMRKSMAKAKEDAVLIGQEILLDYKAAIDAELKNYYSTKSES